MLDQAARITALERRCTLLFVAVVLIALLATFEAVGAARVAAATPAVAPAVHDIIRTHQISVVDARGVERVRVGAPAPDGPIFGKRVYRGTRASGVIIFDAEGNERGGYVTFDDGGAALTLDALGRMVVRLSADPVGGARLEIFGSSGAVAKIGTAGESPFVSLLRDRTVLFAQPGASPAGAAP